MEKEPNWRVRATAWELLAFSLRFPDDELARAVASGEWAEAAREIARSLDAALPEDFAETPPQDADGLLRDLRKESTRLLIGAPTPVVPAYEGLWRDPEGEGRGLLFVNRYAMEVERFCKACGFDRPEGTNEPLDHAATECELLEYLSLAAAGLDVAGATKRGYPGGSPEAAYASFKADHVDAWMPKFADALENEARQPFFSSVGTMLKTLHAAL